MTSLTFEVFEDHRGKYRWRLRHDNGEIVADSGEGYASESGVLEAIERFQEYAPGATVPQVGDAVFEFFRDEEEGTFTWQLRHRNGRVLADSGETYDSRREAERAVDDLKGEATGAGLHA